MNALFEYQTLEYFYNRQTKTETDKVLAWCSNELEKKINEITSKQTKRFLKFLQRKVIENLAAIFDSHTKKDDQQDLFVRNYKRLYNLCKAVETETSEVDRAREKIMKLLIVRADWRQKFLQDQMGGPKIAQFLSWYKSDDANICAQDFNMIVSTFVEELTQTLLSKVVEVLLFPNAKILS